MSPCKEVLTKQKRDIKEVLTITFDWVIQQENGRKKQWEEEGAKS
jgi:hypothetical protein